VSEHPDQIGAIIAMMRRNWPEASADQAATVIAVHRLARTLIKTAQDALRDLELTPTEFEVLCALRVHEPPHRLKPTDLYEAMLISSGGLTKVLKGLEARALVLRPEVEGDGRSRPIELSGEGKALVEQAMELVQAAEEPILRGLSAEALQPPPQA